ncbi:hypothetical protein BGZ81_007053 [Podila clonocystis]|nr:hypothetical protein BGZ81_007053 [Podila clonocystis]
MFFEVDKEYNLIVPLRVIYSSIPYVPRVRAEEVDKQAQAWRWPLTFQKESINPRAWFNDASTTRSVHPLLESISDINAEVQEFRALHESLYELSEHEFLKAVAARNHYEQSLRAKIEALRGADSSLEQEVVKTLSGLALLHQKVLDLYEHHRLNKCQAIMENTNHSQVVYIATALQGTKSVFDVTIRFKWIVSRDELQKVLSLMAYSGVAVLHLDNLTSKAHIHDFENEEDLFVNTIGSSTLLLVSLLNYPRPSEQYLYLGRAGSNIYGLQLNRTAELPFFDWFNMRIELERGLASITNRRIHTPHFKPNLKEVFRQVVFEEDLDVRGVDLFDPEIKMWQGRLGVQEGVLIGLSDAIAPSTMLFRTLLEYGTLRALRLRTDSIDIPHLCSLIEFNPGLQYLDIPVEEERIFRYLQPLWHRDAAVKLQVVLREISAENIPRRIASLVIGARLSESSASVGQPVVDVLRWQCEYVSGLRADQDACVLDTATLKFPSVVTSLTLNISTFTRVGLFSIQKVLQRSPLKRLVIHCSHFNPSLRKHIEQVLSNVQWQTIKSLTLIGDKIDDWICIWAKFGNLFGESSGLLGPRLSCLDIISTDSGKPLSHFSALSLHRLIYSSELVEACLENIQLQDDGGWDLIIGAFDFTTLKSLSILNCLFIKMAPLVYQLKEQLSDLELIVFTLSPGEKHLTFISTLASSDNGGIQHQELDIKGISVDQTSDIWQTLAPISDGFQYGAAAEDYASNTKGKHFKPSSTTSVSRGHFFRHVGGRESMEQE